MTFGGTVTGTGAVNQIGSGRTILTGSGSSVGAVTVSGGTLEFGQTGTFTAASYTTGSGGSTAVDGTAQLVVAGAFTQSAGSTLNVAIGANDPAITAATASLDGTLNVAGYTGTQYTVIHTTGGITGDFANVSIGGSSSPVDYLTVGGRISGNDYIVHTDLTWNAGTALGNGVFTLTNATDAFTVGVALTDQSGTFASGWDGKSLTKNGDGTLTLSAMNTYTGATMINGGRLAIAATGGITSDVTNHATFANAGTVAGSVTNNAGAVFTQTGGSVSGGVTNDGTVNANGGALNGAMVNHAGGRFNVGGTVTSNSTFDNASGASLTVAATGNYTLAGILTNGGGIGVASGGSLTANAGIVNNATIVNVGTVAGSVTNNAGAVLIQMAGSLSGGVTNSGSVNVNGGQLNGAIVNNAGIFTIGGAVVGNDTFANASGATLIVANGGNTTFAGLTNSGGVTVAAGGSLTTAVGIINTANGVITNNGTVTDDLANAGLVTNNAIYNANVASNTGTITNSPGATWNGNFNTAGIVNNDGTINGSLTQSAGTTTNNGTITGAVTVSGGLFTGIGSSGDLTINSGATIAPGQNGGIGTMSVAGNVTFNAGSIYQVAVNAAGQGSRIIATGAITINGGTVNVLAGSGNYAPSTTYTILSTTGGGRTGTFGGVISNLAFLTPSLSYDASDVYLTMTRNNTDFADVGGTVNQRAAGGGVETLGLGNSIWDAVVQLDTATARRAFDQLSGEVHASAKTALIEDSRFVRDAALDRLRSGRCGISGGTTTFATGNADGRSGTGCDGAEAVTWARAFGSWGTTAGDGNAAKLGRATGGFFIGADGQLFDSWRVGILGGIGHTDFNVKDRSSSGTSDNYTLGLYAGNQWGNLAFRSGAAYTWHNISSSRSVAFSGFSDSLKGHYNAGTTQAFGELGYDVKTGAVTFEPFANLAYVNLHTNGFSEHGGAAALTGRSGSTDTSFSTLGLRGSTSFNLGGLIATATGSLGWRHAFGDMTPQSNLRFAGSSAFTVWGVPIARNAAAIDTGLDLAISNNATLGVSYNGQFGSGVTDNSVRANFRMKF
nr:autotransporter domain-containing protein [Bradyrhizobium liaoningense]